MTWRPNYERAEEVERSPCNAWCHAQLSEHYAGDWSIDSRHPLINSGPTRLIDHGVTAPCKTVTDGLRNQYCGATLVGVGHLREGSLPVGRAAKAITLPCTVR